jgi:hypothetical protein
MAETIFEKSAKTRWNSGVMKKWSFFSAGDVKGPVNQKQILSAVEKGRLSPWTAATC